MSRYYNDDPMWKEMWSDLCELVEMSIMLAEEEESISRKTVISEEEEEERKKSLSTRKTRSSSVKRGYSQQKKTPQNSRCSDEEQRAKKGKYKIVYDQEDEDEEESEERLFYKTMKTLATRSRRYPQQTYENLNGASTSTSTSLHYLLRTAESDQTETISPPNPYCQSSCLTENKSRKKAKIASLPRSVPEWLVEMMGRMDGAEDPMLIFETALKPSDVNPTQSRLLMPFNNLLRNDFLTTAEAQAISRVPVRKEDEENNGIGTILMTRKIKKWGFRFKIWKMEKKSGNGTLNYAFNWDWNGVVQFNELKAGDNIRLWTFMWRGVRFFALDKD